MEGKICLVTGTSSGIGKATAIGLARMNAIVVAAMRDSAKSRAALNEIKSKSGKGDSSVIFLPVDLSSQASIRKMAADFSNQFDRFDVLLNNAGVSQTKKSMTVDGIESTFAVNVLAPFLLTGLLLPKLESSSPSRIVNVSSAASDGARIDFDNLQAEKKFSMFGIYGQSKLALNLITVEYSRRLTGTGVTANFLHPGVIRTELGTRDINPVFEALAKFFKLFMGSPDRGARSSIYLATSPDVAGVTGKYFGSDAREQKANPISYDQEAASRLWKICEEKTGLQVLPKTVSLP